MKAAKVSAILMACVAALAGCASSKKSSLDTTHPVTVVEIVPETDEARFKGYVARGRAAVLGGLFNHAQDGGSRYTLGSKVPEIVDDTKAAVRDDCTVRLIVEFDDTKKRAPVSTRCNRDYAVGMKLILQVADPQKTRSLDPRDRFTLTPLEPAAEEPSIPPPSPATGA